MKSISPDIVLKPVKEYILMAVGMLMYSFGWIGCILPAGGVGGGAAGLSLVLCNALSVLGLNFQIGTMVFIINAVLLLVAIEEMRYDEVAATLGIPVGTVMSRLSRGRERLRLILDGRPPSTNLRVVR